MRQKIILIVFKMFKKLHLINHISFKIKKRYMNDNFSIPLIDGLGYENLILKQNWLDLLIPQLINNSIPAIIDIGANIGQSLLRIKSYNPLINYTGFEPNTVCCFYLNKLIEANKFQNVTISHTALFNSDKYLTLNKSYDHDLRGSVIAEQRPGFFSMKELVFGIQFDKYFKDNPLSLVKIDVEGAEYEVLLGMEQAISKHRPAIVCEILDSYTEKELDFTQNRANLVMDLLRGLNFRAFNFITTCDESRIIDLFEIDAIKIKPWTPESLNTNDYIFIPQEKTILIEELIRSYSKK